MHFLGRENALEPQRKARMIMTTEAQATIESLIQQHRVFLFMKGNKVFPSCGFSHTVVAILKEHKVPFETFNVLSDPGIRQGVKDYAKWPTIPQLYIDGEFVGGCDIVREMHDNGELATLLNKGA